MKEGTAYFIENENKIDMIFEDMDGNKTLYTNVYPVSNSNDNKPVENHEIKFNFSKLF